MSDYSTYLQNISITLQEQTKLMERQNQLREQALQATKERNDLLKRQNELLERSALAAEIDLLYSHEQTNQEERTAVLAELIGGKSFKQAVLGLAKK